MRSLAVTVIISLLIKAFSLVPVSRRTAVHQACAPFVGSTILAGTSLPFAAPASAAQSPSANGLASRLLQRDPSALKNRVFNLPPPAQVYPAFLHGKWKIATNFNGYIFPSRKIPKERLTKNFLVPGFQKCSIASTADVGKENVSYEWKIDERSGLEDRNANFETTINAYLGYPAVKEVIYDQKSNPNRIGIDFVDYRTTNAERIELFCNARESEEYDDAVTGLPVFVCSEYVRQVTFGTGDTAGVPRQVGTNYAHYWTWKKAAEDGIITGNLLTAAYLDPQDAMYFEEPSLPVAIYSHVMKGQRNS